MQNVQPQRTKHTNINFHSTQGTSVDGWTEVSLDCDVGVGQNNIHDTNGNGIHISNIVEMTTTMAKTMTTIAAMAVVARKNMERRIGPGILRLRFAR